MLIQDITQQIVVDNVMANLAGEKVEDSALQNSYMSSYKNGSESIQEPPKPSINFNQQYSAKGSWGILRQGVKARIIQGMNNGTARALTNGYHIEALDPKHRMADMLEAMHREFERQTDPNIARKLSMFFIWLDEVSRQAPQEIRRVLGGWDEANKENFIRAGVRYLGNVGRKKYQLVVNGGRVFQNGKLFDTRDTSTHFSGKGWAIYVASPQGTFYAGSHMVGQFHHSSFLSGRPVLTAGEMKVENGIIKVLTAKSGHYKPSKEQFVNGIKALRNNRVNLDFARVLLFDRSGDEEFVPANTFLAVPGRYASYDVWG